MKTGGRGGPWHYCKCCEERTPTKRYNYRGLYKLGNYYGCTYCHTKKF